MTSLTFSFGFSTEMRETLSPLLVIECSDTLNTFTLDHRSLSCRTLDMTTFCASCLTLKISFRGLSSLVEGIFFTTSSLHSYNSLSFLLSSCKNELLLFFQKTSFHETRIDNFSFFLSFIHSSSSNFSLK